MAKRTSIIFLISIVLLTSCSHYNKVLKGTNMDAKLDMAIRLYNKGDFYKALPLLEELITVYRGTQKAEKTLYYYAYTNFQMGDYETAAYDFENFWKTFPSSEFAEECAYMHAYCYYQDSPEYSLDQTNTVKAISELQLFADRFPSSMRITQCNKLIDQLREKLEIKSFENGKMYLNMESYKAAVTTFKNLLQEYPSTRFREQAMFLKIKSQLLLADNSIEEKKIERYNEVLNFYSEFIVSYPESKYRQDADDLASGARKKLEKYQKPVTVNSTTQNN